MRLIVEKRQETKRGGRDLGRGVRGRKAGLKAGSDFRRGAARGRGWSLTT